MRLSPWFFNLPSSEEKKELLDREISALLEKRAIEIVPPPVGGGFYVNIFLVSKANGGFRPVMDLSTLNSYINCPKFKMETTRSISKSLIKGHWAASLDLKDAYLHIPINISFRKFLRFAYKGMVYQCRALPFGLNIAPLVFTKMMMLPISVAHQLGISVHSFLDDWLITAETSNRSEEDDANPNRLGPYHQQREIRTDSISGSDISRDKVQTRLRLHVSLTQESTKNSAQSHRHKKAEISYSKANLQSTGSTLLSLRSGSSEQIETEANSILVRIPVESLSEDAGLSHSVAHDLKKIFRALDENGRLSGWCPVQSCP